MSEPTKLGKYEIKREIGKGAMGIVYEGFDPLINRTVAIKTIQKSFFEGVDLEEILSRFRREAQAAGRLLHPNIVAIYQYDETDNAAFIAMEMVNGKELKRYFDNNERFTLPEIVQLMTQLLEALDYSHNNGVVHRDIKPANIMITDNQQIKITDFGIAKVESTQQLTKVGTVLGTPNYISPEQFLGQSVDRRTDIYSAGVVLYQFLTGEKPFSGDMLTVMEKVLNQEPPTPTTINAQIPTAFNDIIKKAMAKRPEDRYQTAAEFASALQQAAQTSAMDETLDPDATVVSFGNNGGPAPYETPTQNGTDLDLWHSIKSSNKPDDFKKYLAKYPNGTFAALAQTTIAALEAEIASNKLQVTPPVAAPQSNKKLAFMLIGGSAALLIAGAAVIFSAKTEKTPDTVVPIATTPPPQEQTITIAAPQTPAVLPTPVASAVVEPTPPVTETVASAVTTPVVPAKPVEKTTAVKKPAPKSETANPHAPREKTLVEKLAEERLAAEKAAAALAEKHAAEQRAAEAARVAAEKAAAEKHAAEKAAAEKAAAEKKAQKNSFFGDESPASSKLRSERY